MSAFPSSPNQRNATFMMPRNNQSDISQAPHPSLETLPRRLINNKSLSCQFCNKTFRRLEHVQRHERTHTKEKPFKCHCGKNFARRDLLRRHTRLVHDESENQTQNSTPSEETMDDGSPSPDLQGQRRTCPLLIDPDLLRNLPNRNMSEVTEELLDGGMRLASHAPKAGCRLDVLSDAASRFAEIPINDQIDSQASAQPQPTLDNRATRLDTRRPSSVQSQREVQTNLGMIDNSNFSGQDFLMDNSYDFFDNLDFSAHAMFMPLNLEGSTNTMESFSIPNSEITMDGHLWTPPESHYNNRMGHISNLQSGYPQQLQPPSPRSSSFSDRPRSGTSFKISPQDYTRIRESINNFSEFLSNGFSMPSRHTLSRYVEGFFSAFNDHMPFLHLPTLCVGSWSPELSLAIAAVGAKYMFDPERSDCLWHAGRLICLEKIRRRHLIASGSVEEDDRQPFSETQIPTITPGSLSDYDPDTIPYCQSRIETMQAFLILMTVASWGPPKCLKYSLGMQSQVAMLIREDGFQDSDMNLEPTTWKDWIRIETQKRIKLMAYCIFVLQMLAYNVPPLLLNTEMFINLPSSEKQWRAENEEQWRQIRGTDFPKELDFQECFQSLFLNSPEVLNKASPLGYFILIHALLQHIFFTRQTTCSKNGSLSTNEIDNLVHALKRWQEGYESLPQDADNNPESPIAFNSSSLLRLAYTRLHSNLGPCRSLGTRNPKRIALSLKGFPALCRGSRLNRAIIQSVHALSIPIRNGVNFVARTQTFSWSIQHSLCNLEFALLLSKWFETIANTMVEQPLSSNEKSLISMVKTLLEETELATSFKDHRKPLEDEKVEIQQLGYTVIRLWAATFKGSHIFEIVEVIGASLDEYADLLEGRVRVDS